MKLKRLYISVSVLVLSALLFILTFDYLQEWSIYLRLFLYISASLIFMANIVFFFLKKDSICKSLLVICFILLLIIIPIVLLTLSNLFVNCNTDSDKIDRIIELIEKSENSGMIVFIAIQVCQVVFLPLPAVVCYIPGTLIWGPFSGTLLASIGVILGSVISFFIGRFFGKKAVVWIVGRKKTNKYCSIIGENGKIPFIIMELLPFFPDDVICYIAGISSIGFPFFFISVLLIRPLVIFCYCFFGSGTVIPFSGWGIPVWICIFSLFAVGAIIYLIKKNTIMNFLKKRKKDK